MSDIDILVPKANLLKANQILREMGFQSHYYPLEFLKPGKINIRVDLHFMLWYFNGKKLLKRVQWKFGGKLGDILILSPEDNFLHLILHSVLQDGWISEAALEDCRRLLHYYKDKWSWEVFLSRAKAEGWSRVTVLFLEEFSRRNRDLVPAWVVSKGDPSLKRRLLDQSKPAYWRMFVAQDHFWKKISLIKEILFPPLSFLKLRYPNCPLWLLPIARPFLLAWKGLKK